MPVGIGTLGIVTLAVTMAFGVAALAAHTWLSVTHGHRNLVLRAVPIALAPTIVPLPFALWGIIAAFNDIARTGSSGLTSVAGILRNFLQVQWLGVLGASAIVLMAAVAARLAAPHVDRLTPEDQSADGGWRGWLLAGATGLLLPITALQIFVHRIPHVIMNIGRALSSPGPSAAAPPENLSSVSQWISSHLVLGVLGGIAGSVAVVVGIVVTFIASGPARPSRPLTALAWIVIALAIAAFIGGVAGYSADMRWLSEAARG